MRITQSACMIGGALAGLLLTVFALQPQPSGAAVVGDADCSGDIGTRDALVALLDKAGIEDGACSGDTDCDGDTDHIDSLAILRFVGGIDDGAGIASSCLPIGGTFDPTPSPVTTPAVTPSPTESGSVTPTSPGGSTTPTPTATPTATGVPSGTPTPTATATPTATPLASPSPTPEVCDQTLAINSVDALDAAKAIGICAGVTALWVLPNGNAVLPSPLTNYHRGHGLLLDFGSFTFPNEGARHLALSSGTARDESDIDFLDPDPGWEKGYTNNLPTGFPKSGEQADGEPCASANSAGEDGIGLQLQMTAPSGATGFSFDFNYFTSDYPFWVCSSFVDSAAVMVNGVNVLTDAIGQSMNVNSAYANICESGSWGQGFMGQGQAQGARTCIGTSPLQGTGFITGSPNSNVPDGGAATGWRTTTHLVSPNEALTIIFAIWDTADGIYDSTILFDNFRWTYD